MCVLVHLGWCKETPQTGQLVNNRNFSLLVLQARKSKIGVPARPCSGGGHFSASKLTPSLSLCPLMMNEGGSESLYQALLSFMEAPPSWHIAPPSSPTSQYHHLQGLEFQQIKSRKTHSDYSIIEATAETSKLVSLNVVCLSERAYSGILFLYPVLYFLSFEVFNPFMLILVLLDLCLPFYFCFLYSTSFCSSFTTFFCIKQIFSSAPF